MQDLHYGKIVRDAFSRGTRQAIAARWLAPKLERTTGVDDGPSPASPRPIGVFAFLPFRRSPE
jgi:hypothetical protein